MAEWEQAYRRWQELADRGYGDRCFTPSSMERIDNRIRRARDRYLSLLAEHKRTAPPVPAGWDSVGTDCPDDQDATNTRDDPP